MNDDLKQQDAGTDGVTADNSGADKATETKKTLKELLAEDKELQSQYDKKVTEALNTARKSWEEDSKTKMAEAEKLAKMNREEKDKYEREKLEAEIATLKKKDNARTLKDEAIHIVSEKDIPVGYLELIDFEAVDAAKSKAIIDAIEQLRAKDREKYLNEALKQKTPTQKQTATVKEEDPFLKGFNSI